MDTQPIESQESRELELRYRRLQDIFHHFMTLEDDNRDEAYKAIVSFLEKKVDEKLIRYMSEHGLYSMQLKRNVALGLTETCNVDGVEMDEFEETNPFVIAKVAFDGTIEGVAHHLDGEDDPDLRMVYGHVALLKALSPEHLHRLGMPGGIRIPANYLKLKSIGFERHGGSSEIPVVHYHGGATLGASGRVANHKFIEAITDKPMETEWDYAGLADTLLCNATARAAANGSASRNISRPILSAETYEIDQ